ncbi:MAG: redoxin domain-containing protein [Smithella sp.]|jgi:peroxiredoxin (alkyl hydroperoxide reductase subunit C)
MMKKQIFLTILMAVFFTSNAFALSEAYKGNIYQTGKLKPVDSVVKVRVGQQAPAFTLNAISGKKVSLKDYTGKKNVVLSFVPAAWTPVCSDQWPGYNIVQELFAENDSVLLGISVDNVPTLYSWTNQMGKLWFDVLSDFWPHGAVASRYGILRSDGTAERAIIIIDKKGIIRYIDVHDINERPSLESIVRQLEKLRN